MIKKTITYEDFDGNERTEDFYFHLSKAEIAEMELSEDGGLIKMIEKIVMEQDAKRIVGIFKELLLKSYGEKSLDGKRFVKSQELRDAFEQTPAYSELFIELASNSESAAEFFNGVIPKEKTK